MGAGHYDVILLGQMVKDRIAERRQEQITHPE